METTNGSKTDGCTFQWKIENVSHCWMKTGEAISSPTFIADALEGTKWSLKLYPKGKIHKDFVGLFLHRERDGGGPNDIEVNCQLGFLDKDGSFLIKKPIEKRIFRKDWGIYVRGNREKVFVSEREASVPDDTLTVQSTIWNKEEIPVKPKYLYARTVFKENRKSFVWRIDEFLSLNPRKKLKDDLIDFDLVLTNEPELEKKMVLHVNSLDERVKYFSVKTSVANSDGKKEHCRTNAYFFNDLKKGVLSERLFSEVSAHKIPCLRGVLYLDCEYISVSTSVLYEYFDPEKISTKSTNKAVEIGDECCDRKEISLNPSVLVNDLKSMYIDGTFCDTELRTPTRTFKAHKSFLCTRSPVFRRMFTNDMKEKNSGHVDISDLEDDTVHRMLLFIYTDNLEDLQLDSACKLYVAADKYEVLSLKRRCSSFLKENLRPTNACNVLVLADLHSDDDLKNAAQDYILRQEKQIFSSQQWKHLMMTHIQLAADVMHKKIFQE